ncbi:MAG: recombinase RecT [Clostridiales bacterium]|jgi:recombination protein RecT|nr:recombinase RecT [Clostridiales bacterium]
MAAGQAQAQAQGQARQQGCGQEGPPRAAGAAELARLPASQRFAAQVYHQYGHDTMGACRATPYQRQLIEGYFIAIDRALAAAEEKRISGNKSAKYRNDLEVSWANVDLYELALDVMHFSRMGLDMMMPNHLFAIPFKNNRRGKYSVTLMPGYDGIRHMAEKYAADKPSAVTVELVYSKDRFRPIKKCLANQIESYEFEVPSPFDRGEIVGGFGYIEYPDPLKNKLVTMPKPAMDKRKNAGHAAAEFWGGKKKVWENGSRVETETDGWADEMYLKTLKREVYSAKHMPLDPMLLDEDYAYARKRDAENAEREFAEAVAEKANRDVIDVSFKDECPPPELEAGAPARGRPQPDAYGELPPEPRAGQPEQEWGAGQPEQEAGPEGPGF